MAKKRELCRDKRGLFQRNLGWKQTEKGYAQQKFYLGRDETRAKIASLKLEQLWEAVCRRWEATCPQRFVRKPSADSQLVTNNDDLTTGSVAIVSVGVGELELTRDGKPVWDDVSLTIAGAIRNGDSIVRIPVPERLGQYGLQSPSVGHWLDQLRRDVPLIHIELHDPQAHQEAEAIIHEEGTRLINQGRRMVRQPEKSNFRHPNSGIRFRQHGDAFDGGGHRQVVAWRSSWHRSRSSNQTAEASVSAAWHVPRGLESLRLCKSARLAFVRSPTSLQVSVECGWR